MRHIEAIFNALLPDTPGELRYIEELGGGALMDLGCYCLHWIRTIVSDEPTVVSAAARCGAPGVDLEVDAETGIHQRTDGASLNVRCSPKTARCSGDCASQATRACSNSTIPSRRIGRHSID